jgi:VanZ family protein
LKLHRIDKIFAAWIIIVLFLIAWPFPDLPEVAAFDYSDKIVHMILFGVVAFLANGSLLARGYTRKISSIIGFVAGSAYAGLAEIIQVFAPGRNCSIYDFYAGTIGAIIALMVIYLRKYRQETGS